MSYDDEVKEEWANSKKGIREILKGLIKIEFILITDRFVEFREVKEFPDVPLTGWPLVNIEHITKSFIHNPYLVRNEEKKGFGFSIEKHNIVKVYCRIFDESHPRTSIGIPEDPNP